MRRNQFRPSSTTTAIIAIVGLLTVYHLLSFKFIAFNNMLQSIDPMITTTKKTKNQTDLVDLDVDVVEDVDVNKTLNDNTPVQLLQQNNNTVQQLLPQLPSFVIIGVQKGVSLVQSSFFMAASLMTATCSYTTSFTDPPSICFTMSSLHLGY